MADTPQVTGIDLTPKPGLKYALVVTYHGGSFNGWQTQPQAEPHVVSIADTLSRALSVAARAPVQVQGSGRTDAGVHALNQVAHFIVPHPLDTHRLRASVNALAGPHIAVKCIIPVPQEFHARHSALGKTYRYGLYARPYPSPMALDRAWWIRSHLNLPAMHEAMGYLLGTHDFSAFRSAACAAASPVRHLRRLELLSQPGTPVDPHSGTDYPEHLWLEIEGSGFLHNMARILAGTLVAVGQERITPAQAKTMLTSKTRHPLAPTAPAHGLSLARVFYDLQRFPQLAELETLYDIHLGPPWPPRR